MGTEQGLNEGMDERMKGWMNHWHVEVDPRHGARLVPVFCGILQGTVVS